MANLVASSWDYTVMEHVPSIGHQYGHCGVYFELQPTIVCSDSSCTPLACTSEVVKPRKVGTYGSRCALRRVGSCGCGTDNAVAFDVVGRPCSERPVPRATRRQSLDMGSRGLSTPAWFRVTCA